MRVGILGAGSIARVMADTISKMEEATVYAVASRSLEKAQEFAKKYGAIAYGSYEEMLADDQVELVYVATPHSHHYEHMKMCINAGRAVLCEKAFTVNAEQAKKVFDLAREKNVFVTEAIWTRYMPSRNIINELLASGIIGDITTVSANLSYDIDGNERLVKPELAGGALLDISIYGLNFFVMHLGKDIEKIESSVRFTDTGVDGRESITFWYKNGPMAVTMHSIYGRSDRKGIFTGNKGYIIIDNINNPTSIDVFNTEDEMVQHVDVPEQISGYEYEVLECMKCLSEGKIMSEMMPHEETVYMMKMMDGIRKDWGLVYPKSIEEY